MNAPSVDIKEILEDSSSGLGLTFGTDLFIGREPSAKGAADNCVTIFDTPGESPLLTLDGGGYYYPSVQILVRNIDYRTGWDLIHDIRVSLHGRANETWGDETLYTVIKAAGDIAFLKWDENDRAKFVANFDMQRR